jgi:hypothetical protein
LVFWSYVECVKLQCLCHIVLISFVFELEFSVVGTWRLLCNGHKLDFKRDCDVFIFIRIISIIHRSFVQRKRHFYLGGVYPTSKASIVVRPHSHWPSHCDGHSAWKRLNHSNCTKGGCSAGGCNRGCRFSLDLSVVASAHV